MATTYEAYLDKIKGFVNDKYNSEVATAESILNEAKTDANTEYERSKSTYGMLAEQMAQSGLAGSGYSDNLTREAYAARQSSYDNAFKNYNDMLRAAEQEKASGLLAAEEAATAYKEGLDQSFDIIYADIAQGTSKSDLDYYIKRHGFSKAQADSLYKKAGWTLLTEGEYQSLMGNTAETLPEKGPIIGPSQNTIETIGGWKLENITPGTAQDWLASAKLLMENDEAAEGKILEWLLGTPVVNGLTDTSGGATVGEYLFSKGVLKEGDDLYNKFLEKKNAPPELKPEPKPGEGGGTEPEFYATGLTVNNGLNTSGGSGDNFSITDGDRIYRIQLGQKTEDSAIKNKASGLPDKKIFMYGGTVYIKVDTTDGQEVWSIEGRPLWPGHYEDFLNAAKKNMDGGAEITGKVVIEPELGAVGDFKIYGISIDGLDAEVLRARESDESAEALAYANRQGYKENEFFEFGENVYFLHEQEALQLVDDSPDIIKEYIKIKKGEITAEDFTTVSATLSNTSHWGEIGNNFKATIGEGANAKTYKVQIGNRVPALESIVAAEGSTIEKDSLFKYNDKLYFREGDKVFEVEARTSFNTDGYGDLLVAVGIVSTPEGASIATKDGKTTITLGGQTTEVKLDDTYVPKTVKDAAKAIGNEKVFRYGDLLYYKKDDTVSKVNGTGKTYEELLKAAGITVPKEESAPETTTPETTTPEQNTPEGNTQEPPAEGATEGNTEGATDNTEGETENAETSQSTASAKAIEGAELTGGDDGKYTLLLGEKEHIATLEDVTGTMGEIAQNIGDDVVFGDANNKMYWKKDEKIYRVTIAADSGADTTTTRRRYSDLLNM